MKQVSYISSLALSGGEPALHPEIIEQIINSANNNNTEIGSFYIATNGTIATDKFILSLLKLWCYCSDNEVSAVDISNDCFHDTGSINNNFDKLSALSFVKRKFDKDYYDYQNHKGVIMEGRGIDFYGRTNNIYAFDIEDSDVYLNVNGDIINGCDWSYASQNDQKVCHVTKLKEKFHKAIA